MASVLEAIKKVADSCVIMIHDFRQPNNRVRGYEVIEKYLDLVERVDTLYAFRKRQKIDFDQVEKDLKVYNSIPN